MTITARLAPCPFCGGEVEFKQQGNDHTPKRFIIAKCKGCFVTRKQGAIRSSLDEVRQWQIDWWNKRATPTAPGDAPLRELADRGLLDYSESDLVWLQSELNDPECDMTTCDRIMFARLVAQIRRLKSTKPGGAPLLELIAKWRSSQDTGDADCADQLEAALNSAGDEETRPIGHLVYWPKGAIDYSDGWEPPSASSEDWNQMPVKVVPVFAQPPTK